MGSVQNATNLRPRCDTPATKTQLSLSLVVVRRSIPAVHAHQQLGGAQVRASLEQMRREAVLDCAAIAQALTSRDVNNHALAVDVVDLQA